LPSFGDAGIAINFSIAGRPLGPRVAYVERMPPEDERTYPLSAMQQGMLFHHLSAPGDSGVDLEQIVCRLPGPLDVGAFTQAWNAIAERHPVLRTRIRWEGFDEPVQEVLETVSPPIHAEDWKGIPSHQRRERLERFLADDRRRGFDLRHAPLWRVQIFATGDSEVVVVWTFPHILLDGRSFPIVLGDLFDVYEATLRGETLALPPLRSFRDHIAWLGQRERPAAETFWRERLAGFRTATPLPWVAAPGALSRRGEREIRLTREQTSALVRASQQSGVTVGTVVQAAFGLVLGRYAGESEVVFGATRACRRSSFEGAEQVAGLFINTLPVRVPLAPDLSAAEWLRALRAREIEVRPHEHTPLVDVQAWSEIPAGTSLFSAILIFDDATLGSRMRARGGSFAQRDFVLLERTSYPVALYAYAEPELLLKLAYDVPPLDDAAAERMLGHLATALGAIASDPERRISQIPILSADEERLLVREWNDTRHELPEGVCIHHLIETQARATPDATAIAFRDRTLSYRELDARANRLAHHLVRLGVGPELRVGVCLERSLELVVGILAILKAGGAYVPLDPSYPAERLALMLEDAGIAVLLTERELAQKLPRQGHRLLSLDADAAAIARESDARCEGGARATNLAYVIYTSGSTGRPKGVMVEHRNVVNFFAGMDPWLRPEAPGTWLAVTSLSFDISVLELLWTLARGFRVVIAEDAHRHAARASTSRAASPTRPLEMSLFYFASAERGVGDKYRLLLEGAKFADSHGFSAVWTPERHFHAFGGLYPNPAVASAAVAAVTERIAIRAGSVVIALHHPARIAEEWALVDNLSHGRVGVSFASGWQPNDFVLRPEGFANAREQMYDGIETVRRLWRGEAVDFPGPSGELVPTRTLPRPLQPELPVWVTAAGSPETYRRAGQIGANVLTHLLGQSLEELADRIEIYRKARAERDLDPDAGSVTLMLHTFVGDELEEVRAAVREPMLAYLRSSVGLIKSFAASWTAFKKRADGATNVDLDIASLSREELDGLLEYSFERYFETSALFGTPERCVEMIERVRAIGVDEVACLIDFGVDTDTALEHLRHLDHVRKLATSSAAAPPPESIAELIRRHAVTHMQCTPSLASLLLADPSARETLGSIGTLFVGGEAFPAATAAELARVGCREIWNLYGPTETTIWSSIHRVSGESDSIPIGRPIANTQLHVLDAQMRLVPVGIPGELYIGGRGVVRGYWQRPDQSSERFVADPFAQEAGARLYRTGDLVRRRADGAIEFLGRLDHQVKIRGHRVELGEIEASLCRHPSVREAVVVAREETPGEQWIVAYIIPQSGHAVAAPELRRFLRDELPEFMLPSHFVELERFPQTPNRKVDRKALPPPGSAELPAARTTRSAAANEVEEQVARIWQEVLQIADVAREDNFFDLGGHSLLAVKAHRRLVEAFGREVPITDLFRFPTVRALAEHLSDASAGPDLAQSASRGELRRQALSQRRERLASRRAPGRDAAE
jgi:natural product biosynthesis luciferase-like monooxygenase protein